MAKNIDNAENEQGGGKALSGNQDVFLRLPYGLAKKHGINTANMTPRQVWDALKGKGVNPQKEMDSLKAQLGKENHKKSELVSKHEEMIKKYELVVVSHPKTKEPAIMSRMGNFDASDLSYLREHKDEIIQEIETARAAKEREEQDRRKKIEGISGLRELETAISEWNSYAYQATEGRFNSERTSSFAVDKPTSSVEELREQYPRAAAYLRAKGYENASNYQKAAAGRKAKERIINGEDYGRVIKEMEAEWSDAVQSNIWD